MKLPNVATESTEVTYRLNGDRHSAASLWASAARQKQRKLRSCCSTLVKLARCLLNWDHHEDTDDHKADYSGVSLLPAALAVGCSKTNDTGKPKRELGYVESAQRSPGPDNSGDSDKKLMPPGVKIGRAQHSTAIQESLTRSRQATYHNGNLGALRLILRSGQGWSAS